MSRIEHQAGIPGLDLLSYVFGQGHEDVDKPIYIDAHNPVSSISERQALSWVKTLIGGLRARGVKPGDAVCMHSFNNIYYALFYLAIIGCGASYVGTNPVYTTSELSHIMSTSRVSFVVVEPDLIEKMLPSVDECNISREHVIIFDTEGARCPPDFDSWTTLLQHGEEMWVSFDDEARAKSTTAALLTTSGTTGMPKAAEISHYAFVAQSVLINTDTEQKPFEIRRLFSLPQFHAFAGPLMNLSPLLKGIPTYIMKKFSLPQFVHYVKEYAITETAIVNPILLGIVAMLESQQRMLDSLETVWVAGAHLDADTQNRLRDALLPKTRICQVWGMTEIGWITTLFYPEKDSTGTAGRLLPGFEAKVIDEGGVEITDDNIPGEVLVRGPSIMTGYLQNPDATASTVAEGWLRSGDVGHQCRGKFYIHDRVKDIIKVRGWQVSPTEVEACLLSMSAVRDAAVIGVHLAEAGEIPRAYVVMDGDTGQPSDEEMMVYLAERLAKYKLPTGGIWRVDAIPRSASGKILKKVLRAQARAAGEERTRLGLSRGANEAVRVH